MLDKKVSSNVLFQQNTNSESIINPRCLLSNPMAYSISDVLSNEMFSFSRWIKYSLCSNSYSSSPLLNRFSIVSFKTPQVNTFLSESYRVKLVHPYIMI